MCIFIDSDGHIVKKSSMVDEHQIVKITEKVPEIKNIGKIVCGDTYSNIITFEIKRYYDNVDLLTKNIKFIVNNELGTFTEDSVNTQYNDELLRFSWILSDSVTYKGGDVKAAIVFLGTEQERNYALKTIPFTLKIDNSLDLVDVEPPYKNWFVDIENELVELRNIISGSDGFDIDLHSHSNKDILDKFSLSNDGNLLYNGKEIANSKQALSAYEVAVENGFKGTEVEWLDSLKGQQGDNGTDGKDGVSPTVEDVATQLKSDTDFVNSLKGDKGDKGDPGQDCSVVVTAIEVVTELKKDTEFLESVKGEKGDKGDPGTGINLEVLDSVESVKENIVSGKLVDSLVIKEVFTSVSDGKALIASAITDKGIQTDATATFAQMAENIRLILTGGDDPSPLPETFIISTQPSEKLGSLWIETEDGEEMQEENKNEFLISSIESNENGASWDENSTGTQETILGSEDNGEIGNMWIE